MSMSLVEFGDGPTGLMSLPAGSVGLILSDLPSGETAADFDEKPDWVAFWRAAWHGLRPNGQAVLMASSLKFAAELLDSQREFFRDDLVWEKSLAVGFLNAKKAPLNAHEFILVFSRSPGVYHPQMLTGFVPISSNSRSASPRSTLQISESYGGAGSVRGEARAGATDRYPRSVIHEGSIPTVSRTRCHPQQKPQSLLRRLIRQYSDPGDLVVDPYAGSGSTGAGAEAEGRPYRCWDSSPRFGRKPTVSPSSAAAQEGRSDAK